MKSSWRFVVLVCLATLGLAVPTSTGQTLMAQESATKTYEASSRQLLNPERGWWYTIEPEWSTNQTQRTLKIDRLKDLRQKRGVTVVRKYYVIDDWRTRDIPYDASDPRKVDLRMVDRDFAAVREAGMKLIPRFVYVYNTDDARFNRRDASEVQTLRHIDQLAPIWKANRDVLLHLQAGFIGCWGEWHQWICDSPHVTEEGNLTRSGVNIARHLLESVPGNRQLAFRYPYQVGRLHSDQPLATTEYYSSTERSRIGFANDSIAYDEDNRGTYRGQRSVWQPYMRSFSRVNVMDGEPSGDTSYARQNLTSELRANHFDLLNMNMPDHACDSLYSWLYRSGNFEVIRKRLGYRFSLLSATYPTATVRRGNQLNIPVRIKNRGWGKAFNPRAVVLVMRDRVSGREYKLPISGDGRKRLPLGGQTRTLNLGGELPVRMQAGRYSLFLHLADPLLPRRPAYSIRLANRGVWEPRSGYNDLGIAISVK